MSVDALKRHVRAIAGRYVDREQRARRLFLEERAAALHFDRDREFRIRSEISSFFSIPYSAVGFCGSAQLGFSISKNALFQPGVSDLDAACVSPELFQAAWRDVVTTTRAFSDLTPFNYRGERAELLKDQISRRGMIRVDIMPQSELSRSWRNFQDKISRKHTLLFKRVSIAVYINEYAFSWKQDSVLNELMG